MDIKCDCGKLVGKYKDEKLYLYCKKCKKEVEVRIDNIKQNDNAKLIKINKLDGACCERKKCVK